MHGPIAAFESYLLGAFRFGGRAARSEYWWPNTVVFALMGVAAFADLKTVATSLSLTGRPTLNPLTYWSPIMMILTFVPSLSSMARRLHDSGRSAWWILVQWIPLVGPIVLLGMLTMPSRPEINEWGPPRDPWRGGPNRLDAQGRRAGKSRHVASPLDSYAVLLQRNAERSADETARRKQEVHDYFMRNISRSGTP
ncbi:uncharacterized membrane protein YhaH (DUF805 family) [Salipiger aestuarii]|uniref:Uncharacterized membrane protein YhaH (DUF805 family) n=1 Tax=Salipiger aestuarii TaxID=568098 RepID=A0A327YG48_9RHOB|nr:DUF805 domain-containing protein [Salipiger aestuarii]RAK18805.1 uncharacterized membrane protein YhaH (DUF805 family) [Salipiger aestuarii]